MWIYVVFILPAVCGYNFKPEVIGIRNDQGATEATIKFQKGFRTGSTIRWRVNGIDVLNGEDGIEITTNYRSGFNLRGTSLSYYDGNEPDDGRHFAAIKIPASFDVTNLTAKVTRGYQHATIDINTSHLTPGQTIMERITDTAIGRASSAFGCGVLTEYISR